MDSSSTSASGDPTATGPPISSTTTTSSSSSTRVTTVLLLTGVWALPFAIDALEPTGEPFLVAARARAPTASTDGLVAN